MLPARRSHSGVGSGATPFDGALEDVFFSPILEDAVFQRGEGLSGVYWVEHELLSGYVAGIVTQATKNRADS